MARRQNTRELHPSSKSQTVTRYQSFGGTKDVDTVFGLVLEGETEKYYFDNIKQKFGLKLKYCPKYCPTTKIKSIDENIQQLSDAAKIFCVFDLDRIYLQGIEEEAKVYEQLHCKYKNNAKVHFCVSLPSFELWLLLHFSEFKGVKNHHFSSQAEVISELQKYLPVFKKGRNCNWFQTLQETGDLDTAINNAESQPEGKNYSFTRVSTFFEQTIIKDY